MDEVRNIYHRFDQASVGAVDTEDLMAGAWQVMETARRPIMEVQEILSGIEKRPQGRLYKFFHRWIRMVKYFARQKQLKKLMAQKEKAMRTARTLEQRYYYR